MNDRQLAIERLLNSPALAAAVGPLFLEQLGWQPLDGAALALPDPAQAGRTLLAMPLARHDDLPAYLVAWPCADPPTAAERRTLQDSVTQRGGRHLICYLRAGGLTLSYAAPWTDGRLELRALHHESGTWGRVAVARIAALHAEQRGSLEAGLCAAFDDRQLAENFFSHYRALFEQALRSIAGFGSDGAALHRFVQRLLARIVVLCMLERSTSFKFQASSFNFQAASGSSFYHHVLRPLVVERRAPLPGGLFRVHADDLRADVQVPDELCRQAVEELCAAYPLTLTEQSSLDREVAVGPEILADAVERLAPGRQASGSYYTPGPLVEFLCRATLRAQLGDHARRLDHHDARELDPAQARALLERLAGLRVLDPACGGGAFLVGMLRELLALRRALVGRLAEGDAHQEAASVAAAPTPATLAGCLHGVDIDPLAVDVAQARLQLALLAEGCQRIAVNGLTSSNGLSGQNRLRERIEGVRGEAAGLAAQLPNLDAQIVVGDSLAEGTGHTGQETGDGEAEQADSRQGTRGSAPGETEQEMTTSYVLRPTPYALYDIVVGNPPYGLLVDAALRDREFDRATEGAQSRDAYGLFIALALRQLRPGGTLAYVVSDTWRTLRSHRPLRRRLLHQTAVSHVIDLPSWIFSATVGTCLLLLANSSPPPGHALIAADLRATPRGDWPAFERALADVAAPGADLQGTTCARYTYAQHEILRYEGLPFFIASPRLYALMSDERHPRLGAIAEVKVGLQTGDNSYYIRKRPGARGAYALVDEGAILRETELAQLTADEQRSGIDPARYAGRHFIPYDKGGASAAGEGWLPSYHVPTDYFIDWSRAAVRRLRTATIGDVKRARGETPTAEEQLMLASVIRNPEYYFRGGITFSDSGIYAPSFRRGTASVFDQKGSTIFPRADLPGEALLALLCSRLARYLYKNFINHTVSAHVDSIKELPCRLDPAALAQLAELGRRIIERQQADPRYPYHLHEQRAVDELVYQLYGLSADDVREVERWYCRRYPKLARAQGVLKSAAQRNPDYLAKGYAMPNATNRSAGRLPRLQVSANQRFLVTETGAPFFWLGDTAWELFHRLTIEEAGRYFANRQSKGFNVVQAAILAELDGLGTPNAYGELPLLEGSPNTPNPAYFQHVDELIGLAAEHDIYLGLLPTWGDKLDVRWGVGPRIFTEENAFAYGRYLGERYRAVTNIIWVLGGDRSPVGEDEDFRPIWRAMASGIRSGLGNSALMTYHPPGGHGSAQWLHDEPWLSLNMLQSGHVAPDVPVWQRIWEDYNRTPPKPTLDGEPNYEDHPINFRAANGYFRDYDVRKQTYRSVFAGGCGVTYGHHAVWQFLAPGRASVGEADRGWLEALDRPGAAHMRHLRALLESRPFQTRLPDQELLVAPPAPPAEQICATRCANGTYALVYIPAPGSVELAMGRLASEHVRAWWYDPRRGEAKLAGEFHGSRHEVFTTPVRGPDWVLVLDEANHGFGPPGR